MELNVTCPGGRLKLDNAQYLGDGVYIGFDSQGRGLAIITYNGMEASNVIFLELEVQISLHQYLKATGVA